MSDAAITTVQSARRAADAYWERRARGEAVSVDDVIDLPSGSEDFRVTRVAAIGLIADDLRHQTGDSAGFGPNATIAPAHRTIAAATVHAGSNIGPGGAPPKIDGYDVVGCLGRGGMGAVYEAYQQSTGRRVAIKLMLDAAGMSPAARTRFEREVEVVARLEHPGIISIVDSGVRKGRYFYVMEYVDGQPLDRAVLPGQLRRALEMLAEVCEAVDYAHQRGVLHRDLKPTNVIVDSRGRARLLDFGIAKLIDEPGADPRAKLALTMAGPEQLLGTVSYMSPEQAQGRNDQTSVRTDVYALGAIGYELATGKLPCSQDGTLKDVLTCIAEVDPPAPSSITKAVPKDIDAVLLKALEKKPENRYPTAGELATELRRWLAGEPVQARRLAAPMRAGRWVLRNRTLSITTAAALVALGTVSAVLISRMLNERDHARENFAILRGVLESADPERSAGLTVPQMLDQATKKLDDAPPRLDATEADVREILGGVYRKFGEYDKARAQQERVLKIRELHNKGDSPAVADALHNLAATLWWDGKYQNAEVLYQRSLDMRQRLYRGDNANVATSLTHLAACRLRMGRITDATDLYTQALEMRRRLYGDSHEEVAQALNNLAKCEVETEHLEHAEQLFREALAMVTALKGKVYAGTAAASQNLGDCLLRRSEEAQVRGDTAAAHTFAMQARDAFASARDVRAAIYVGGHHLVAISLGSLAKAELVLGNLGAAQSAAAEGLEMIHRTRRSNHPDVSELLEASGLVALQGGNREQAEKDFRAAIEIAAAVHPPAPLRLAILWGELASAVTDPTERSDLLSRSETQLRELCGESSYLTQRVHRRAQEAR
jgi:tetratricopeptide (TPR) repeat protein/predicted Ser/Thr protein kinase